MHRTLTIDAPAVKSRVQTSCPSTEGGGSVTRDSSRETALPPDGRSGNSTCRARLHSSTTKLFGGTFAAGAGALKVRVPRVGVDGPSMCSPRALGALKVRVPRVGVAGFHAVEVLFRSESHHRRNRGSDTGRYHCRRECAQAKSTGRHEERDRIPERNLV